MPEPAFHPAVTAWFRRTFPGGPTAAQRAAWPAIAAGRHVLVAAPTGSGKTLAAFLTAIDALVQQGLQPAGLPEATAVLYVSPLKALSNDIRLNLEAPLAGIAGELAALGLPPPAIRSAVRTGDTPAAERTQAARRPPHILVTTPESLYVLLGSVSGRKMLAGVRSVIVDEIHAVAASKRGSHLALSLQRLDALCPKPPLRIGLSATVKPIDEVARFLVGTAAVGADGSAELHADCEIVDIGHARKRELALDVPPTPLAAVMSGDQWQQVYARVAALALAQRTTLVFVNTRRMAERAARHLGELLGREQVAAHHGSLAREARLSAEQRLKRGELKLLVATASLELGLDIGDVDLVCQLGSPRAIATFLQRAGRSGHAVGGTTRARLFPQTRDELVECAALLDAVRRGELDALRIPAAPLDVLAQQIVAEVACRGDDEGMDEDALYALVRGAWPYARLARADHDAVVRMLAEGFTTSRGPRSAWLHRDAVQRRLRARRGARMTALTSGGTIPDTADYQVLLEPQAQVVGTVNEDFAVESLTGDIFQLGNASYRILRIEPGRVRVEDAQGVPPNIPFWLGEAPGRSDELSLAVARLREEVGRRPPDEAPGWLQALPGVDEAAAVQIAGYLHEAAAALGALPTQRSVVLERFFDESGGMQLVVHAPFGSRINRAWGLALRKRFCRSFNFELQAAATEDAVLLSLSTSHSFPLQEVAHYLHSATATDVLVQAVLDAPLFGVRWRWNATTALALPRFSGGRKVAPQLQRMKSEDLLAGVFPDQVACLENIQGDRQIPDHPLVAQTLHDCLNEAMDAPGWLTLLRGIEDGRIVVHACETTAPSPLAAEVINARPYAFLDDAPLEERRTQAVQSRRGGLNDGGVLGRLDPQAIASVREEAWPQVRSADEMHEALSTLGAIADDEARREPGWPEWLLALAQARRATRLEVPGTPLWVSAEGLPLLRALHPQAAMQPEVEVPAEFARQAWTRDDALRELVRARLGGLGPVTVARLAAPLGLAPSEVELALLALQREGQAMQGRYSMPPGPGEPGPAGEGIRTQRPSHMGSSPDAPADEWCDRHLLARIHRYTLHRLRREIEPVEPRDYMRFLLDWQHLSTRVQGPESLAAVLAQLEGYEAPAAAWEAELLPARVADYSIAWLDELCSAGRVTWTRLRAPAVSAGQGARQGGRSPLHATPLLLLPRRQAALWTRLAPPADADAGARAQREDDERTRLQRVLDHLAAHGASFFDEIADGAGLLAAELEDALAELVARGRVHCDSYGGLRALLLPAARRPRAGARQRRAPAWFDIRDAGRWALVRRAAAAPERAAAEASAEHVVRTLLRRYGILCWRLLEREAPWLPPWRELLRICRRLEARGEIRGGRFIAGLSGEQFALPEAVAQLRQMRQRQRDRPAAPSWVCVAASDPANLLGSVLPGKRVPRIAGARVLYRDGIPVGSLVAGRVEGLQGLDPAEAALARRLLLRGPAAGSADARRGLPQPPAGAPTGQPSVGDPAPEH